MSTIQDYRKKLSYRFLESFLGIVSISFLTLCVLLAFYFPTILAILLIAYGFFTVLKTGLHGIYTVSMYQQLKRWEKVNWLELVKASTVSKEKTFELILELKKYGYKKIGWEEQIDKDLKVYKQIENTKYDNFENVFHIPLFSVYNESPEIITKSLLNIYNSQYDLSKIVVFISQEARAGEEINKSLFKYLENQDWIKVTDVSEKDLDIVYKSDYENLEYSWEKYKNIKLSKKYLTVVLTQHPDGLVGEIKGKASNEDWGARQASLFISSKKIDPDLVLVTSLDSDSRVGNNFFQMLSYRFCLTEERHQVGFQPLPVYSNNFFSSNLFPRLVATNTTIWYMIQSSLVDELHFFANYAVPLKALRKIDFWNREVIAEDSMLFSKCFVSFHGDFKVVPFFGTFEGDAVEGGDYFETIINQYKQLQRWAWGGIEGFPYKFTKLFLESEGKKIDLRKRIKIMRIEFLNHFFWATLPLVFSVIILLPQILGNREYRESAVQFNLWILGQYFAWLSFIFLIIAAYITYAYIAMRATKNIKVKWYHWVIVSIQWFVSPLIFIFMGPPALDVQIRGILGKYLGYWVTPKK